MSEKCLSYSVLNHWVGTKAHLMLLSAVSLSVRGHCCVPVPRCKNSLAPVCVAVTVVNVGMKVGGLEKLFSVSGCVVDIVSEVNVETWFVLLFQ